MWRTIEFSQRLAKMQLPNDIDRVLLWLPIGASGAIFLLRIAIPWGRYDYFRIPADISMAALSWDIWLGTQITLRHDAILTTHPIIWMLVAAFGHFLLYSLFAQWWSLSHSWRSIRCPTCSSSNHKRMPDGRIVVCCMSCGEAIGAAHASGRAWLFVLELVGIPAATLGCFSLPVAIAAGKPLPF